MSFSRIFWPMSDLKLVKLTQLLTVRKQHLQVTYTTFKNSGVNFLTIKPFNRILKIRKFDFVDVFKNNIKVKFL